MAEPIVYKRPHIEYYAKPDTARLSYRGRTFVCSIPTCAKTFQTMKMWEEHDELFHR